jgi:hypothetical protein
MYVYMYMYMYIRIYLCTYVNTYVCACIHVCVHIDVFVSICMYSRVVASLMENFQLQLFTFANPAFRANWFRSNVAQKLSGLNNI